MKPSLNTVSTLTRVLCASLALGALLMPLHADYIWSGSSPASTDAPVSGTWDTTSANWNNGTDYNVWAQGTTTVSGVSFAKSATTITVPAGVFSVGEAISGTGIPAGATIVSVNGTTATISVPTTAANSGTYSAGYNAIFGGTGTGAIGITLGTPIIANGLEFTSPTESYTLSASSAQTITLGNSTGIANTGGAIEVDSGVTATIGANVTVNMPAGANAAINGGGTLNVASGGAIASVGNTNTLQVNDATLNIQSGGSVTAKFMETGHGGVTGVETGTINVTGGTLTAAAGGFILLQGGKGDAGSAGSFDSMTITGGTVTAPRIQLTTGLATETAAIFLNGGTLTTLDILNNNKTDNSSLGSAYFYFNGGTLAATGATANFMQGLTAAYVGGSASSSGSGAVVNNNGFAITIAQALQSGVGVDESSPSGAVVDGGFVSEGAGTTTLSGANTYTGATTVLSGTLQAGVASVANVSGAFGDNSAVVMANTAGATLSIVGFNTQIGSLTGGGTTGGNVVLGSATLTLGGDNTSPAAYAGTISGAGGVTKIGSGTQTFSGANTYTGATRVSAGTLSVTGSLANTAVTVASGAILTGTGSIAGATEIMSGATLAAGISPGTTLAFSNGLAMDAGSNLTFVLGSGNTHTTLALSGGTNTFALGLSLTFTNIQAGTYDDIITGLAADPGSEASWTITNSGYTAAFTWDGGNIDVTITSAVPEPSTWAMMLGGLAALTVVVRHRRRNACGV